MIVFSLPISPDSYFISYCFIKYYILKTGESWGENGGNWGEIKTKWGEIKTKWGEIKTKWGEKSGSWGESGEKHISPA